MGLEEEVEPTIKVLRPVTLTELFQTFGLYVSQAVGPLTDDLREFRAHMARQLTQLRDELVVQSVEIAGLNVAFKLKAAETQRRMTLMEERIGVVEDLTSNHEAMMKEIFVVIKILKWVGSAVGASILALIWGILTGRVQLVFR